MRISSPDGSGDQLRSLRSWLAEEDELRGHIELVERPAEVGQLGPTVEAIAVAASSAIGVMGHVLVTWLKTRVGSVTLVVHGEDGKNVGLSSTQVAGLDSAALAKLLAQIDALSADRPASGRSAVAQVEDQAKTAND